MYTGSIIVATAGSTCTQSRLGKDFTMLACEYINHFHCHWSIFPNIIAHWSHVKGSPCSLLTGLTGPKCDCSLVQNFIAHLFNGIMLSPVTCPNVKFIPRSNHCCGVKTHKHITCDKWNSRACNQIWARRNSEELMTFHVHQLYVHPRSLACPWGLRPRDVRARHGDNRNGSSKPPYSIIVQAKTPNLTSGTETPPHTHIHNKFPLVALYLGWQMGRLFANGVHLASMFKQTNKLEYIKIILMTINCL